MPRIEFESDGQRNQFNYWIGARRGGYGVTWIGEFDLPVEEGRNPEVLETLRVDNEPVLIMCEKAVRRGKMGRQLISAEVSNEHMKQLEFLGVIFEGSPQTRDTTSAMPIGELVTDAGDQV